MSRTVPERIDARGPAGQHPRIGVPGSIATEGRLSHHSRSTRARPGGRTPGGLRFRPNVNTDRFARVRLHSSGTRRHRRCHAEENGAYRSSSASVLSELSELGQLVGAANGILGFRLPPVVVCMAIGAVLRFIDLVGRAPRFARGRFHPRGGHCRRWMTRLRGPRHQTPPPLRSFSALICTPQDSLRRADRFADQAREMIGVDGLHQVIVEPVLQ